MSERQPGFARVGFRRVGAAAAGGLTPADVNALIAAALVSYSTTAQMNAAIASALGAYSTTAQMNAAIAAAVPADASATAVADVQDLTISGLNGDTDGGYVGWLHILGPAAGTPIYTLQPNGLDTNQQLDATFGDDGTMVVLHDHSPTTLIFGGQDSANAILDVYFQFDSKSGRTRSFQAWTYVEQGAGVYSQQSLGKWTGAGNITSLTLHGSTAGSILTGSTFFLRKMKRST